MSGARYVSPDEIAVGDTVAPGGMFAARGLVTDITEARHPLAGAAGAVVLWVDYLQGGRIHPITRFPWHTIYRITSESESTS